MPLLGVKMNLNELNNIADDNPGKKIPLLFVGHGSPMNAIEDNSFSRKWKTLGEELPKPEAILCVSAHWETRGTFVTAMKNPPTIHDFGGFPEELFNVQYPAPGKPELAEEIHSSVKKSEVGLDEKWGLDHGTWSVIKHMYPKADIPVVQLSLDYYQNPQFHFELARELAPLRKKKILIIGSGNIVHNLRMVEWSRLNEENYGYDWAIEANEKVKSLISDENYQALIDYKSLGKEFSYAIPTSEHFLPLLYILALKEKNEKINFFNDTAVGGSLTMTSIQVG